MVARLPQVCKSVDAYVLYINGAVCAYNLYFMQATAGHAYTALHSSGFGVVLGTWQIHVLLLGTFWEKFCFLFFGFF